MSIPFMDRSESVMRFWTEGDEEHVIVVTVNRTERTFLIAFDDYPPLTAFHAAQVITLVRDGLGRELSEEFAWRFNSPIVGWCNRWQNRFDSVTTPKDIDHEVF